MKKLIISIAAALTAMAADAQVSHALYFMESVPQTNLLNPARQPRATKFIAIPGANVHAAAYTNLVACDFFQKKDGEWLTLLNDGFDYSDLYDIYKKQLAADLNVNVGILSFGWRNDEGHYLSFNLSERVSADVSVPADLLKIGDKGLPDGTMLDLAKLGVSAMAYTELAASYSRVINEQWTAGVRIKLLAGTGAVWTKNNKFDIQTGEDKWHIKTDIEVMAALPLETDGCIKEDGTIETDSIDIRDFDKTKDLVKYLIPRLSNPGGALDLGVTYKLNDNFRFSASVTDLGFISWGRDINRFKSRSEFDFDGIDYDIDNEEHEDDFQNALEDALDTLQANCQVTLGHKRFSTPLHPSVYVGAEYTPVYFLNVGFLSNTKFMPTHRVNQDFSLSATLNPYKLPASATFGYTINVKGQSSASCGLSLRMGVLQFYTVLDYVPFKYDVLKREYDGDDEHEKYSAPHKLSNVNITAGLNIVLGSKGYKDRPMLRSNSRIAE